jgi:hypothetical protein
MGKSSRFGRFGRPMVAVVAAGALALPVVSASVAAADPPGRSLPAQASQVAGDHADIVKLSQRVRELIRLVERSDLRCEIRNELVRRLRLLDDTLRSGNIAGARALVSAWRAWVAERAGTGLLAASVNDVVQERLAPLEGQIGLGWAEDAMPVRNWPKLPQCETSSSEPGAVTTSEPTWNSNDTLTVVTTAVKMIPGRIGTLLAGEISLMWPSDDSVDVTAIVDQAILDYAVADGGAKLSAIEEENRLYFQPALDVWLEECGWTEESPADWVPDPGCGSDSSRSEVIGAYDNMYADLVNTAAELQLNSNGVDYRAELLPLYVQVENLLIAHLQLGVMNRDNWWPDSTGTQQKWVNTLQMHTETEPGDPPKVGDPVDPNTPDVTGVGYVEQVYQDNTTSNDPDVTDYPVDTNSSGRLNITDWKARNAWARDQGTIQGLYFSDIWPFMDPITYPNGNPDFVQTRIIYTDPNGCENPLWHYYPDLDPSENVSPIAPGNVSGPLSRLEVWQDDSVDYLKDRSVIDAVRVTPEGGTASPIMGDPNPAGIKWDWQVGLSTTDPDLMPIVSVHVAEGYQSDANVYWPQGLKFWFPDGGVGSVGSFTTTSIPDDWGKATKLLLYDYSYDGQVLATVKVLDVHQWKDTWGDVEDVSADCVMFGFRFADSF